jgi:hypothetical protein
MGVRKIAQLAALVGVLGLAGAAPAFADEALIPSGELVYTWHGDPARGCATVGVCGVQGALTIRPDGDVDYTGNGGGGPQLYFGDAQTTVRVRRTDPGSSGTCVDTNPTAPGFFGTVSLTLGPHGAVRTSLEGQASSGRCAGPLVEDLGRLALRGTRTSGKHPSFAFRQSAPFTAGPYSGTFSSDLRLVRDLSPDTGFSSTSGGSSSGGRPPRRFALFERVTLRYRMTLGASALTIPFQGENNPFCAALDACGVSGSLSLGLQPSGGTFALVAERRVTRRVPRRRSLADFRSGRLGILLALPASMQQVTLTESLQRAEGPSCRDSRSLGDVVQAWLGSPFTSSPSVGSHGPSLPIVLTAQSRGDLLRTYCPGPSQGDVFNSNDVLGRGSISRRQLLATHSTVDVSPRGSFAVPGYTGSMTGSVPLSLTLLKITAATVRERIS